MNTKLTFPGGEPDITVDNLLRNSTANRAALFATLLGLAGATDLLVSGAVVTVDPLVNASVTAGYVWFNGEILQVDAATVVETQGTDLWEFQKVVTFDSLGDKVFLDATPRQTYQKNRAVLVNVPAITGFNAVGAPTLTGNFLTPADLLTVWIGRIDGSTGNTEFSKGSADAGISSAQLAAGQYEITHNFGDTDYTVNATVRSNVNRTVKINLAGTTTFIVETQDPSTGTLINADFYIEILR